MIQRTVICTAAAALGLLQGCHRAEDRGFVAEPYLSDDASVAFDLEPLQSGGGSQQWIAIYSSHGTVARFRIEFEAAKSAPAKSAADFDIKFGEGRLMPEPESDSTVLLVDLQKALQAKRTPVPPLKKTIIPFTYANIGDHLSQAKGGGFSQNPPGNWSALKLFLGKGDQEADIFLNINAKIKKGQFSMKDPDYGDLLLAELAKAL